MKKPPFVALALLLFTGACAWAQSGAALLVLNKAEATMAIVDPQTLKVLATVPTGEGPHEVTVSADGRLAIVANYGTGPNPGSTLSIIDIAARKELKRVDLNGLTRPHGIAESGGKIYFTAEGARAVGRLDPAAQRVDWVMGTGEAVTHMLALTPDGKKLYTANIGSDTITTLSLEQPTSAETMRAQVAHIKVGIGPEGIDVSPDGREVWVGNRGRIQQKEPGTVSVIDAATNQVVATIPEVGVFLNRLKFTPDGKQVWVSAAMSNQVVVIDAATRKEVKRIRIEGMPLGILMAPDGRAFVAAAQANKVFVVDRAKLEVIGSLEPGREPDGMAWAGK